MSSAQIPADDQDDSQYEECLEDGDDKWYRLNGHRSQFTSCGNDPYKEWMDIVGSYPLLTREAEMELGRAIRDGREAKTRLADDTEEIGAPLNRLLQKRVRRGDQAFEVMVMSNLRLVASIAKSFNARVTHMDQLDLMQVGTEGLLSAVRCYNPDRGMTSKFGTMATGWIKQAIKRGIDKSERTIKIASATVDLLSQARLVETELTRNDRGQCTPTHAQIGQQINATEEEVRHLFSLPMVSRSLDEPVTGLHGDGSCSVGDQVADVTACPDTMIAASSARDELHQLLADLDPQPRQVLQELWGTNNGGLISTSHEVGRKLGLGALRVRQIERTALTGWGYRSA